MAHLLLIGFGLATLFGGYVCFCYAQEGSDAPLTIVMISGAFLAVWTFLALHFAGLPVGEWFGLPL